MTIKRVTKAQNIFEIQNELEYGLVMNYLILTSKVINFRFGKDYFQSRW